MPTLKQILNYELPKTKTPKLMKGELLNESDSYVPKNKKSLKGKKMKKDELDEIDIPGQKHRKNKKIMK